MLIDLMKKLILPIVPFLGAREKYRPERHYMRGPGPKAKARPAQTDDADCIEA